MLDVTIVQQLSGLILDPDFSVSSDALETFGAIFTAPRKPSHKANVELSEWVIEHVRELHKIFQRLKKRTEDVEEGDEETHLSNYFSLREIMKLEYTVINEHRELLEVFSNDQNTLLNTFNLLNVDNDGVQFEAVLHLSVFVLMPDRSSEIVQVIKDNKENIAKCLEEYIPQKS